MKKRTVVCGLAIVLVRIAVLVGYRIYQHWRIPTEIAKLKSHARNVRREASVALGKIGPAAVPALIAALKDENESTRMGAVSALAQIGPPAQAAVPALIEILKREEEPIYNSSSIIPLVARALRNIGPEAKAAVPALVEVLKDEEGTVRPNVAFALWKIDRHSLAIPSLVEALLSSPRGQQLTYHWAAARYLGEIGPEAGEAVPALIENLTGNWHPIIRSHSARSLGKISQQAETAVPALIKALIGDSDQVRRAAIEALGEFGPEAKAALPILRFLLLVPPHQNRVAEALKKIAPDMDPKPAPQAVVPWLVEGLKNRDAAGRKWATKFMISMSPEANAAVPALMEALRDDNADVRAWATSALIKIGPGAKAAIPALEARKDDEERVRWRAAMALQATRQEVQQVDWPREKLPGILGNVLLGIVLLTTVLLVGRSIYRSQSRFRVNIKHLTSKNPSTTINLILIC